MIKTTKNATQNNGGCIAIVNMASPSLKILLISLSNALIISLIINRLTLFKLQKVFQKTKPINNYNIFVSAIKLKKTVTFKHKRL